LFGVKYLHEIKRDFVRTTAENIQFIFVFRTYFSFQWLELTGEKSLEDKEIS